MKLVLSMKKILFSILMLIIISIIACQPVKKEVKVEVPKVETTDDATTDSFGSDMGNVDSEDKELSSNELEGIDSGFSDIENI